MMGFVTAANTAFLLANLPGARRFRRALARPRETQEQKLLAYMRANADTRFGQKHGFAQVHSVGEFQRRVPLIDRKSTRLNSSH